MALEGTLESFSISEIFQLIATQGKTGVLEIDTGDSVARIRFVGGEILDAYPGKAEPSLYIGNMLVRAGLLTESQLEFALNQQKKNLRKLGDILIRMGTLRTREFQEMLALQRREMAYSLLRLKKGGYKFSPAEVDYEEEVDVLMNVESILMEGSRQIDEWPEVLRKIPSDNRIYKRRPDAAPQRELSEEEAIVLGLLDGANTVREVIDKSRLGEFPAWSAIANLYDEQLITQLDVQKRRTVKPAQAIEIKAKDAASAFDVMVGVLLAAIAVAVAVTPVIMRPPGGMSLLRAYGDGKVDFMKLEARTSKWETRAVHLPERAQKQKANIVLPTRDRQ